MTKRGLLALFAVIAPVSASAETTVDVWGTMPDGRPIHRFTMTNASGAKVSVMELGAAVTSVVVPDRNGRMADVALGYDTALDYVTNNSPQLGLVIGRYANRIVGGKFRLEGTEHQLATQGRNPASMHGGPEGFGTRLWKGSNVATAEGDQVQFQLVSPDGDQGFPGEMAVTVTYSWSDENDLLIEYAATTTKPTVVNLTNHSYFNLAGAGNGDVLSQQLTIGADYYMEALPDNTPTGQILAVKGTPFDFSEGKPVGQDIDAKEPQMVANRGYNVQYVLRRSTTPGEVAEAARYVDPDSGRELRVLTTEPGVFLYTANFISTEREMKGGIRYPLRAGVALETQHFPDSPNWPHFPRTTLLPGQTFLSRTVFAFDAQ